MQDQIISIFERSEWEDLSTWQIARKLDIETAKARKALKDMEKEGLIVRSPRFKWTQKNCLVWCLPSAYAIR